jgi:uncharacterized protein
MNCPRCANTQLLMADRQGIEIDYCPQCRGVWLDRGELDKIIERSSSEYGQTSSEGPVNYHEDHHGKYHEKHQDKLHGHHKRKSLLMELFD